MPQNSIVLFEKGRAELVGRKVLGSHLQMSKESGPGNAKLEYWNDGVMEKNCKVQNAKWKVLSEKFW